MEWKAPSSRAVVRAGSLMVGREEKRLYICIFIVYIHKLNGEIVNV